MTDPDKESWLAEPENPEPADFPDAAVSPKVQAAVEAFERARRQIPPGMRKTMADTSEALRKRRAAIWSIARGPHWHVFEDRGITPEIMVYRPYAEWTPEHHEPLREAWGRYTSKSYITRIANQSGGFVIHRHPPPDLGLDEIPAEIRPHARVDPGPDCWHDHDKAYGENKSSKLRKKHLRKKHAPDAAILFSKNATVEEDRDVRGWHAHPTKYVFPPSPRIEVPWSHDHDEQYAGKPERRTKHVEKWHDGADEAGEHSHTSRVKDEEHSNARRIDVHPLAVPLLDDPKTERVFFGIEGCLKADAILAGGEAVFSVPSVTLWGGRRRADELEPFADRYLRNKIVFITPDADWQENDRVITQAMMARQYLRRLGIESYVAAPSIPENPERDAGGKLKHNGVDDFLAAGGTIDDLVVVNREVPAEAIREWVRWQDAGLEVLRDSEVLQCLALHAGHAGLADRKADGSLRERPGEIRRALSAQAALLGWPDWRRVGRAIEKLAKLPGLESDHAITIEDGGLELKEPELKFGQGGRYMSELDYERRPLITIAPEFRADESDPVRLGDFEPGTEQFAMVDTTDARRDRERRLNRERQARYQAGRKAAA